MLSKYKERPPNVGLGEYVVLRLVKPYFNSGRNVTVDNFFTSLHLANELSANELTLVGTMSKARRETPEAIKTRKDTLLFFANFEAFSVGRNNDSLPRKNFEERCRAFNNAQHVQCQRRAAEEET
jgi:hypothetical protein